MLLLTVSGVDAVLLQDHTAVVSVFLTRGELRDHRTTTVGEVILVIIRSVSVGVFQIFQVLQILGIESLALLSGGRLLFQLLLELGVLGRVGQIFEEQGEELEEHLCLLVLNEVKLGAEHHEVRKEGVEVGVQAQLVQKGVVGVVQMGQYVEQVLVDAFDDGLQVLMER